MIGAAAVAVLWIFAGPISQASDEALRSTPGMTAEARDEPGAVLSER